MIKVRAVMNCKPGGVGELVEKFKAVNGIMQEMGLEPFRIFTDISGEQFWTLVLEREYESLGDYQRLESEVMADPRFGSSMAGYHDLVHQGRREIYKVEA
ncbi:MAG: hypothetical protein PVJ76_19640 [Gemmatimonadota bacterium]|jgi:hypothetical protein